MCLYGTYKYVHVVNSQNKKRVKVDACIAQEIQELNDKGIFTLSCCCSHGESGNIVEYENGYGKWKTNTPPPHVLIKEESVKKMESLGYRPFPYYYADGEHHNVWQVQLKTGCITYNDCVEWHTNNKLPAKELLGIVE